MSLPKLFRALVRVVLGGVIAWGGSLSYNGVLYALSVFKLGPTLQALLGAALTLLQVVGIVMLAPLLGRRLGVRWAAFSAPLAAAGLALVAAFIPSPKVQLWVVACVALTAIMPTYVLSYAGQRAAREGVISSSLAAGVATCLWFGLAAPSGDAFTRIADRFGLFWMLVVLALLSLLTAVSAYVWFGRDAAEPQWATVRVVRDFGQRGWVIWLAFLSGAATVLMQLGGVSEATAIHASTASLGFTLLVGAAASLIASWTVARWTGATYLSVFILSAVSFGIGSLVPHVAGHARVWLLIAAYAGIQAVAAAGYSAAVSALPAGNTKARATEVPIRTAAPLVAQGVMVPFELLIQLRLGFDWLCVISGVVMVGAIVLTLYCWRKGGFSQHVQTAPEIQSGTTGRADSAANREQKAGTRMFDVVRLTSAAVAALVTLVFTGMWAWRRFADHGPREPEHTVMVRHAVRLRWEVTQQFAASLRRSIDAWTDGRAMLATHLADVYRLIASLPEADVGEWLIDEIGQDAATLIDGLPRVDRRQLTLFYAFVAALGAVTVGRVGSELLLESDGLSVVIGRGGRLRTDTPSASPAPELAWRDKPRRWRRPRWLGGTARSTLVLSALRALLGNPTGGEIVPLDAAPLVGELMQALGGERLHRAALRRRCARPQVLAKCSAAQLALLICCGGRVRMRDHQPLLPFRFGHREEALVRLDGWVPDPVWQRGGLPQPRRDVVSDGRVHIGRELLGAVLVSAVVEAVLGTAWLAISAGALWFGCGWIMARARQSERRRRRAVGLAAGLFQGPSFFWAQFAVLIGAATHETGVVSWSTLGLTVALAFGLLTVVADHFGTRRLIIVMCGVTLGGVALIAVGGANIHVLPAFVLIAVAGTFMQFGATRAGVLVSAHETAGMDDRTQLSESRSLRRWFEVGIYAPSFFLGWISDQWGWVTVYGLLTVLYALALRTLWSTLRAEDRARMRATPASNRASSRSLWDGLRTVLGNRMLLTTALAALAAQATVFATVQGVPLVLRADDVSHTIVGVVQGAAIAAALFVTRPKRTAPTTFGRFVPAVGVVAVACAAVVLIAPLGAELRPLVLAGLGAAAVAFISSELLKQWGQTVAQVQARRYAPAQLDYAGQAVWLLGANLGAVGGAVAAAQLAQHHAIAWLLVSSAAALSYGVITLAWYRRNGQAGAATTQPSSRAN